MKNALKQILLICFFPIVMLIIQILKPHILLIVCAILFIFAILFPTKRISLLILSFVSLGYLFWLCTSNYIVNCLDLPLLLAKTISRFGLMGYLVLFTLWHWAEKPKNIFLRYGDSGAIIKLPFIWKGIKETELRFTVIFSLICLTFTCFFAITTKFNYQIILYGILFSFVNAVLEELLWRGFILARILDILNEKTALVTSALAFGLYHYSLQFPIWTCLVFAIGGFYMGGSAIKSKGLLSPIIMHIMVNIVFVFSGIIS